MAFIAMLLLTSMSVVVRAQDGGDDSTANVDAATTTDQAQADKGAAVQLAKEEKKRAARQKKRTMESCLTLVRSFYSGQDDMVQDFVQKHPTNDKSRLLSKILSQMMIVCNGAINEEQIAYLQDFKHSPADVDYTMSGYAELIEIDWEALKYKFENPDEPGEGEGTGPVEMTSQEILMSNEVEDYSDDLKRESEQDLRQSLGKTQVAFIDIENMGTGARIICFVAIFAGFAAILKFFHKELADKGPDLNEQRKE